MNSTSHSLLLRLRGPNRHDDWQRFVELYAPLIYSWSRSQGLPPSDAADLVQEILTYLLTKLTEFEYNPTQRFRGWLRTVVRNKARDFLRRKMSEPMSGQDSLMADMSVADGVDLFDEAEYRGFLVNRMMELMQGEFREDHWQACWKHIVEGRKAREVAAELGISVNMVYLATSRVLSRLREELGGLMC